MPPPPPPLAAEAVTLSTGVIVGTSAPSGSIVYKYEWILPPGKKKKEAVTLFKKPHLSVVLQEVWACWCELLSYLEQENAFLDQLEQKLDETENLQGGAEELQEALDVSVRYRCKHEIKMQPIKD